MWCQQLGCLTSTPDEVVAAIPDVSLEPVRAMDSAHLCRSTRLRHRDADALMVDANLPSSDGCSLQKQWQEAMRQEYASLNENDTFTPVMESEANSAPIGSKWVYKTKRNPNGTLRYKARLVIKGYEQVEGVNFAKIMRQWVI